MKPGVVLDKNFLQGGTAAEVEVLSKSHLLIMPGALFYELMTTSPEARRKCFSKLPRSENPVELIDHIGLLLRHEIHTNQYCGKPSSHRLPLRFQFNEKLLDYDYRLPPEAQRTVDIQAREVEDDVERLIDLSEQTADLFPGILEGTSKKQAAKNADMKRLIADIHEIVRFFEKLESPDPTLPYPNVNAEPENWAHIRWLQVLMMFASDLYVRYRGKLREQLTDGVRLRLEHDVHDAQVLALACLEGSLASRERKLRQWWSILKPDGQLFPAAA